LTLSTLKFLYLLCSMQQRLTPAQALEKIKHYCAYQERSHDEVKQKLYGYGLYGRDVDQLMATLIEGNYLNEERFALAFAGGRFRLKHWGKIKIRHELQARRVSSYNIQAALRSIPETDYEAQLQQLARKKMESLKSGSAMEKHAKTYQYLLQKGFESALISRVLQEIKPA
jgi:regulatory protein